MKNSKFKILIVGAGYVGLTLAAKILKDPNLQVNVFDKNEFKINELNNFRFNVYEPNLDKCLKKSMGANRLAFKTNIKKDKYSIIFICIGTPKSMNYSAQKNTFLELYHEIEKQILPRGSIFIRSTVYVGITDLIQNHALNSGRTDLKIYFAPERTSEGNALIELEKFPQLLGSSSPYNLIAGKNYLKSLGFDVLTVSSTKTAEFIKLISNIWRDSIFGISNEFAKIAEHFELDIYEAVEKSNFKYTRSAIPLPGPVGGPCLSKDTYLLFDNLPHEFQKDSIVYRARKTNENLVNTASNQIIKVISTIKYQHTVIFIGAAFKGFPRTNDHRNSFVSEIVDKLKNMRVNIKIWDPTMDSSDLGNNAPLLISNLTKHNRTIIVFGNNSEITKSLRVRKFLLNLDKNDYIFDYWGSLQNFKGIRAIIYKHGIGYK